VIKKYYKAVYDDSKKGKSGAILFGVCRGKISEGLDFSDKAARAVVIVGVPYPSLVDSRTILKREYLDKRAKANTSKMR